MDDLKDPAYLVAKGGWTLNHFDLKDQKELQEHVGPIKFDAGDGRGVAEQYGGRSPAEEMKHLQHVAKQAYEEALRVKGLPPDTQGYPSLTTPQQAEQVLHDIEAGQIKLWDGIEGKINPILSKGFPGKSDIHIASMPGADSDIFNSVALACLEDSISFGIVWEGNWGQLWFQVWTRLQHEAAKQGKHLIVLTKSDGQIGFNQTIEVAFLRSQGLPFAVISGEALISRLRPLAAETGEDQVSSKLLEGPAASALLEQRQFTGEHPLHIWSKKNKDSLVAKALRSGAKIEGTDFQGFTPLIAASINGATAAISLLLRARAQLDVQDEDGCTALYAASDRGHTEAISLLLRARAQLDVQTKDGCTALFVASDHGHTEAVRLLLEARAELDVQTRDGYTALHVASYQGRGEAVRLLLDAKANTEVPEVDGCTALWIASQNGREEAIGLLLGAKSDMNMKLNNGQTAISIATKNGHKEAVRLLLNAA